MGERKKVAVVTGGGTGIGLACAEELCHQGWEVFCIGLQAQEQWPQGPKFHRLDVTVVGEVQRFFAEIEHLDGLINAAGVILHNQAEFTPEGFDKVINVNLSAVNLVTLNALSALKRSRGAVVNIASMWSQFGSPRNPAYSASKGAVTSLTRSHAVAFAPFGVRVNAVAPGWIDTQLASGAIHNPERSGSILSRIPLERWGQPSDIAKVAAFLFSDSSAYVTGVVLPVDGGFGVA